MISYLRRKLIQRRLRKTMRPDPLYAKHRAAQLPPARKERFLRNVADVLS